MIDPVVSAALLSLLRVVLSAAGVWLVARGYFDSAAVNDATGALLIVLPAAWGVLDKWWTARKTKEIVHAAANGAIAVADHTVGLTPVVSAEQAMAVAKVFQSPAPSVADAIVAATTVPVVPSTEKVKS